MHFDNFASEAILLSFINFEIFPNADALSLANQLRLLEFTIVFGIKVHIFWSAQFSQTVFKRLASDIPCWKVNSAN
jgi:hypothetical protein